MSGGIKVVQVGCGKMSAYTMRYTMEKNGTVVGAFDINQDLIGKDISQIAGGEPTGVCIEHIDNLESSIKCLKPDIAIITTQSLVASIYPLIETLCTNGVNCISICEELFYAWDSNPGISKKIDEISKTHGVTVTGSGYQDVSWGSLVTTLAATAASIKTIHGTSSYNLEDYGLETTEMHGAGLSTADFEEKILGANNVGEEEAKRLIANGEFLPGYMWPVNGWVTSALGLHPSSITQRGEATTYTEDLHSDTLGTTIPAGEPTGLRTFVTTETEEGVTIITECIGRVFAPGETDVNEWAITGEPDMCVRMESPATVEMTCSCCVNRLPDVIAAEPGYVTSEKIGSLSFKRSF